MHGLFEKAFRISTILTTLSLTACDTSDFDLDLRQNEYGTSAAVKGVLEDRPRPDARGVISYPNYQVAVAQFDDTLQKLATRIGVDADLLGQYNGIDKNDILRQGEIIALPEKLAPTEDQTENGLVNVTELAENAIKNAQNTGSQSKKEKLKKSEPIRHKVKRGETAFTISRLYNVTIRSLAEWNSLDADFTIREDQYVLIPIRNIEAPKTTLSTKLQTNAESLNVTPAPPSAKEPLPDDVIPVTKTEPKKDKPKIATPSSGAFAYPVNGKIIREFVKNKTDGIDLSAPTGSTIVAAQNGVVAAITTDADQMPILVIKHEDNILTVYANIGDIIVSKGAAVKRGQPIGKIREGNPSFLHFEIRQGFESIDPMDYLM